MVRRVVAYRLLEKSRALAAREMSVRPTINSNICPSVYISGGYDAIDL